MSPHDSDTIAAVILWLVAIVLLALLVAWVSLKVEDWWRRRRRSCRRCP